MFKYHFLLFSEFPHLRAKSATRRCTEHELHFEVRHILQTIQTSLEHLWLKKNLVNYKFKPSKRLRDAT